MRFVQRVTAVLSMLLVLASTAGCTVGPSTRPALATSGAGGSAAVPVTTTASPLPTGAGGPGRPSDPISWSACSAEIPTRDPAGGAAFALQCAQVQVPKTYASATSGTFSVAVAKATSTATPADAPPLVVMIGNAGANGTHRIASIAGALPAAVLAHFAVMVMDIRGTGDSVPIDCVSRSVAADLLSPGPDPTKPTAAAQLADLARTLTFDCGDMVGPDLSDFSTILAADDLDTIRSALGVRRIAFLGRGFGATLGAVYADRYPGRIASAVLDGPSDPSATAAKHAAALASAQEKALASFAAA